MLINSPQMTRSDNEYLPFHSLHINKVNRRYDVVTVYSNTWESTVPQE